MNADEARGIFIVTDEPRLTEEADNAGCVALGIVVPVNVFELILALPRPTPEVKLAAQLRDNEPSALCDCVKEPDAMVFVLPFPTPCRLNELPL